MEVEPCVGIISASLPTLRPILIFFLNRIGLSTNESARAQTPSKPPLVTFGRMGVRNKRNGYTTTMSLENDHNSLEHLSGWPEEQHGKTVSTIGVGQGDMELNQFHATQPQSIAVTTEMAWDESYAREARQKS